MREADKASLWDWIKKNIEDPMEWCDTIDNPSDAWNTWDNTFYRMVAFVDNAKEDILPLGWPAIHKLSLVTP